MYQKSVALNSRLWGTRAIGTIELGDNDIDGQLGMGENSLSSIPQTRHDELPGWRCLAAEKGLS